MAEFNIRADSVDVMQIMERIRKGIREQRGPDDTERQHRELAEATRDRCLEPRRTGSDLFEHNRRLTPPGRFDRDPQGRSLAPEPFEFNEDTVYVSSRGAMGKLIRLIRRLLNPILRLFFNPDPIIFAMMRQAEINERLLDLLNRVNVEFERTGKKFRAREELDALNYEVVNNLVAEMTRLAVDMKNHKMLVESVAGRLDFDQRQTRALESVQQTRSEPQAVDSDSTESDGTPDAGPTRTRRRRRRSRRRPGGGTPDAATEAAGEATSPDAATAATEGGNAGAPVREPADRAASPDQPQTGADASEAPAESVAPPAAAAAAEARDAAPPAPSAEQPAADPPRDDAGDR